jgi:hypothetical protein
VNLDEATVGRSEWEPGWRCTTDLGPIAGTATSQVHHLGLSVSGRLHVEVFVSSTTGDLLDGSGITVEDAGSHEMKGLAGERRVFRVVP